MGKNNKSIYFLVVILLLIVFVLITLRATSIKELSISNIDKEYKNNSYTMLYFGEANKDVTKQLKNYRSKNDMKVYKAKESFEDGKQYLANIVQGVDVKGNYLYILFDKQGYIGYIDETMNTEDYINKYLYGYLPPNERKYSTITVGQYQQLYNSKEKTIAVFGDDSCSYCNQLENVINDVVTKKVYDINYFNASRMTSEEYQELMNMEITIPAECVSNGMAQKMSDGYAKPMTIVSKKGKVLGCIKGYYDYNTYVSKLKAIMEG